jgi:malonate transporter and related proteins
MRIVDLILPVCALLLTGWLVGYTGYLPRKLAEGLIHFAYNVALPALLIVTIAQEPSSLLLNWRFLVAFGGGSLFCFFLVFVGMTVTGAHDVPSRTMYGMAASMTNTAFVALPVLHAIFGQHAVLPAAIAIVFVAVIMFPVAIVFMELGQPDVAGSKPDLLAKIRHVLLNPMVLATLVGMLLSVLGLPLPGPVKVYLNYLANALAPCALFAIGLGLSIESLRTNLGRAAWLSLIKLIVMPAIVFGLSRWLSLDPLYTIAAVICAAVPTAKTAYILAGEYHCEEPLVAATVSLTTVACIVSLAAWLYGMSGLAANISHR